MPIDTLIIKKKGAASNDVARLKGSRFVTAAESEKGDRLAENLIKQLTGDDTISARFLYQETFEFHDKRKTFFSGVLFVYLLPSVPPVLNRTIGYFEDFFNTQLSKTTHKMK